MDENLLSRELQDQSGGGRGGVAMVLDVLTHKLCGPRKKNDDAAAQLPVLIIATLPACLPEHPSATRHTRAALPLSEVAVTHFEKKRSFAAPDSLVSQDCSPGFEAYFPIVAVVAVIVVVVVAAAECGPAGDRSTV